MDENTKEYVMATKAIILNYINQIIFEGESTNIGREITIERIKEFTEYYDWLVDKE